MVISRRTITPLRTRNNRRLALCWIALATVPLAIAGCGGPTRGAVTGKVTLDGQPVDGGTILFALQAKGQRGSSWADIVGGRYSIAAAHGPVVGPNRVEIHWPQKTGRKLPHFPTLDELREAVPRRYHYDSELRADVKPGENQFDFALTSK